MPYGKKWSKEDARRYVDELKGITIPINFTFDGRQKILCLTQVENLLRKAKKIAITDCECRTTVRGCNAPIDVCLYLDDGAKEQIEKGLGKEATLEGALDTLRRANEAGLVYVAYVDKGEKDPQYICSCCSCCCHSLIAMQEFGYNDAIISSDMVAVQHDDLCDDCGLCAEICHFKARRMANNHLVYEREKCFGCGLCIAACSSDAISLNERQ